MRAAITAGALALLLAACGQSPAEKAKDAKERADAQAEMSAMRKSADGSAAKAVGDMMSDPEVARQMGMAGNPPPPPPRADAPPPPPAAAAPTAGPDGDLAATGSDDGQARALATCRALRPGRGIAPHAVGPLDVVKAAAELARNPNALGECQRGM